MDDELQEIRDNFYVGNFAKALQLCQSTQMSNDLSTGERDATLARCCLALDKFSELKAMQNSENPGQKAAALTAVLSKSKNDQQREQAKEKLTTLAKESHDVVTAMLAVSALAQNNEIPDAVTMSQAHQTQEMQALRVYLYLLANRADMAERQCRDMAGANDDSAVFRLASAAVKLATGDPQEGYLTYGDLASQFPGDAEESTSAILMVGKAVANMQRGMFTEAVEDLVRAQAVTPNDPDVLVNSCCCATHLKKPEEFQQSYAKLEQMHPNHPYVKKTQSISAAFQRFQQSVAAK